MVQTKSLCLREDRDVGSLLVLQSWVLEQVVARGFSPALWLSVEEAGLAGSGAVATGGLKSDVKVHLANQSPRQFLGSL